MKKLISALLIVMMSLNTTICFADGLIPGDIKPLQKGDTAPFAGLLLSPAAVAKVIVDIDSKKAEIDIAVNAATEQQKAIDQKNLSDSQAECDRDKKVLQANLEYNAKQIQELQIALKKTEDNKPNLLLYVGGGIIGGAVLVLGSAFVVISATK